MSPSMKWSRSYKEALQEKLTDSPHPEILRERINHLRDYLSYIRALSKGLIDGTVPQYTFWLIKDEQYLGEICIRLKKSGRHPTIASHIYYEIRPSMRNQGYGTQLLTLGLNKARSFGLERIFISVNKQNIASRRIIEKCGGIFKKEVIVPDESTATCLFEFNFSKRKNATYRIR